jgi:hypothetical protein
MVFEQGKYYSHPSGEQMSIVGEVETTLYGKCLMAESNKYANIKPVGKDESNAENWSEISKDEWMKNFS